MCISCKCLALCNLDSIATLFVLLVTESGGARQSYLELNLERLVLSGKTGQLPFLISSFSSKAQHREPVLSSFTKKPDILLAGSSSKAVQFESLCNQQAPVFSAICLGADRFPRVLPD